MRHIRFIFLAAFFFALHMALIAYVNSSMLGQFASSNLVSITYAIASILSLIFVMIAPQIVRIIGNFKYITIALLASSVLLFFISNNSSPSVILLFVLYFSLNSVVLYGLDIFLEHYSLESSTGNIRGLYLTLGNMGWVLGPIASGALEAKFGFPVIYLIASLSVATTLFIIYFSQKGFVDRIYDRSHLSDSLKILKSNKDLRTITILNFLLQLFFVIMVIYSPVYLVSIIGFSWKVLGLLLSIMLLPFIIFPYPAGYIADKYIGEKELLYGSLILMGLSTIFFSQIGAGGFAIYAVALFLTRVGASIMEAMSDSSFFKRVNDEDSSVISVYRNMMPVAYIIGPLIGALVLSVTSYQTLFILLGICMLLASFLVLRLKDTK
ncbi:MAG: MFS transporter [Candidatus Pacebacteria bacterium]|nr:MFS transporter [Candidatus Paceibacterota bacterium]